METDSKVEPRHLVTALVPGLQTPQCDHGYPTTLRYLFGGWRQPYAKTCPACKGEPAGIKFKPAKP